MPPGFILPGFIDYYFSDSACCLTPIRLSICNGTSYKITYGKCPVKAACYFRFLWEWYFSWFLKASGNIGRKDADAVVNAVKFLLWRIIFR